MRGVNPTLAASQNFSHGPQNEKIGLLFTKERDGLSIPGGVSTSADLWSAYQQKGARLTVRIAFPIPIDRPDFP